MQTLTQEFHDKLVSYGCDPTCHTCYEKINVGDWFDIVEMPVPPGIPILSIKGTVCGRCIREGRAPCQSVLKDMLERYEHAFTDLSEDESTSAAKVGVDSSERPDFLPPGPGDGDSPVSPGCFFTDEGKPF